jgi:hypothetical protein
VTRDPKISIPLSIDGKLRVNKIEMAVFQLETAIEIWFADSDPISAITLTFSAHEIIYQIDRARPNKRGSIADPRPDLFVDYIADTIAEEWPRIFKFDYNSCKHGGADPVEVHFLATKNIPIAILDAVHMYSGLGFHRRAHFDAFIYWQWMTDPSVFVVKPSHFPTNQEAIQAAVRLSLEIGKKRCFEMFLLKFLAEGYSRRGSPVAHTSLPIPNG